MASSSAHGRQGPWLAVLILALTIGPGLRAWAAETPSITLVSSLPLTGSAAGQTTSIVNGIRLAIDQAGGAVAGFRLVYQSKDDASASQGAWDASVESDNANAAAADPDVMVYIGTYNSGAAKIAMPILNRAGLVMISPANTYVGLTKHNHFAANEPGIYRPTGKINFFRVVPADDIQGQVGAQWAHELGCKSVYILHDRELYGQGLAEVFRDSAQRLGMTVAGYEGIDPKQPSYQALVTKIGQADVDLVYFGGTSETNGGQIAKDLVSGGVHVKLMVPDGCFEAAFINAAGAANLNGRTYVTFGGLPAKQLTGRGKAFYAAYIARYHSEPEAYAAYGYECAAVAIDAIRRAGVKDRARILAAVAATHDFHGVLGTWSFDADGDTSLSTMSGNEVKDGHFVFSKVLILDQGLMTKPVAVPGPTAAGAPLPSGASPPSHGSTLVIVIGVVVAALLLLLVRKPKA